MIHDVNIDLPKEVKLYIKNKLNDDHAQGYKNLYDRIRVWTVNDPNEISRLLDIGVNTIITDFPGRALALRSERKSLV